MAIITGTQIMEALLLRLRTQCGSTFRTYSRRFITWEDLIQQQASGKSGIVQPALFLFDGMGFGGGYDKIDPRGRGSPQVVCMYRTIVVYARMEAGATPAGKSATQPAGDVFYPLQAAIEAALAADDQSSNTLTLGGLVSHCWQKGDRYYITGETDPSGQGMMTIPLEIMQYPLSS